MSCARELAIALEPHLRLRPSLLRARGGSCDAACGSRVLCTCSNSKRVPSVAGRETSAFDRP